MNSHIIPNNPKNNIDRVIAEVCNPRYLQKGELHKDAMARIAGALADDEVHFRRCFDILKAQRFLPGGRIQSSMGSARLTTAFNCFVSPTIPDSRIGIFDALTNAAETMGMGGGIGMDFSTIRPRGALIKSQGTGASGPISYMKVWDTMCNTIASAGNRRGAMMGVLRVDHPDIEEFIDAKREPGVLTRFNVSVACTDEFMKAVKDDTIFALKFEGQTFSEVRARYLWDKIMRSTWSHAEPGVLFIDTINNKNNLYYCENIASTNPCLHPDSLIETVQGRIRIADIKEPIQVYTMKEDGSLGVANASASWVSKKNTKTYKITTRNGKVIKVTPDHKMCVHSGSSTVWIEAKDLKIGHRLVQLCRARRGIAYSGIKLTTEDNRAYRMEHRMIAEAVLNRPLTNEYDIHHIDGDTYNNSADNLQLLTHSEHSRYTALFDNPQSHQVLGEDGCFVSTGITPKTVIPMPESLRSNMKNNYSSCVDSIEECDELVDVYDMSVEGTHNFIADFCVVHNCGEQPLPPDGACLLGSFDLTKYVEKSGGKYYFDTLSFSNDIPPIVRMMDNVIDNTQYPTPEQESEARSKRRMGLGITGLANVCDLLEHPYGSENMIYWMKDIMTELRDRAYRASADLAEEKGVFPLYDDTLYPDSNFVRTLPAELQMHIGEKGMRNSHLLSIAPTGTISLFAGNVSSGIEPPFSLVHHRDTVMQDNTIKTWTVMDYAYDSWGVKGKTSGELTADEHINVLCEASKLVDSSCSKTCNVGDDVSFEEFKQLYIKAYEGGASGCTTFRPASIKVRGSVIRDVEEEDGDSCIINLETGERSCAD